MGIAEIRGEKMGGERTGSSWPSIMVNLIWSFMPLTATLIIISFSSPTLSFIPNLKPFFLQFLPTAPFLFLLQD